MNESLKLFKPGDLIMFERQVLISKFNRVYLEEFYDFKYNKAFFVPKNSLLMYLGAAEKSEFVEPDLYQFIMLLDNENYKFELLKISRTTLEHANVICSIASAV